MTENEPETIFGMSKYDLRDARIRRLMDYKSGLMVKMPQSERQRRREPDDAKENAAMIAAGSLLVAEQITALRQDVALLHASLLGEGEAHGLRPLRGKGRLGATVSALRRRAADVWSGADRRLRALLSRLVIRRPQ